MPRLSKGVLLHCWWGRKLLQLLWTTVTQYSMKLNLSKPYGHQLHSLACTHRNAYMHLSEDTSVTPLLMRVQSWKQPNSHQRKMDEKVEYVNKFIQWNSTQQWKRNNYLVKNTEGAHRQNTEKKKPSPTDYILGGSIYPKFLAGKISPSWGMSG